MHRAVTGEPRVLVIRGEPGVGKTRLGQEMAAQMQAGEGVALRSAAYAEGDLPYGPIARMVYDSFPQAASLNLPVSVLADLITMAPRLRSLYPEIPLNPCLDPRSVQQLIFESVAAWCEAMSGQAPLLLFLDDAHWADSAALFLLRHLALRGRGVRLLLIMAAREDEIAANPELGHLLIDLDHERLATHLRLERLGRDETYELLAAILGADVAPELLEGIFEATEGNPFFVEEICRAMAEAGNLSYQDSRWHFRSGPGIEIPQTVRAAILSRVARLAEPVQTTVRLAAMIGSEFDFEILKRAGDLDDEALIDALESGYERN